MVAHIIDSLRCGPIKTGILMLEDVSSSLAFIAQDLMDLINVNVSAR